MYMCVHIYIYVYAYISYTYVYMYHVHRFNVYIMYIRVTKYVQYKIRGEVCYDAPISLPKKRSWCCDVFVHLHFSHTHTYIPVVKLGGGEA